MGQVFVVEPATRAVLVDGQTTISLAMKNDGPSPVDVRINLQWLNPDGHVDLDTLRSATLPPGESSVSISHPLPEKSDAIVERLEYRVFPSSRNYTAFRIVTGRLSFANIADYAFSLGVVTIGMPAPNQPFELRVLAAHPLTGKPVAGVKVEAEEVEALTGPDGVALLRIRRDPDDTDEIDVSAQIGDFHGDGESTRLVTKRGTMRGYTDKPIYQPGQTMHMRVLALDAAGHAAEGREFELRVADHSGESSFSAAVKTSRFGIASADWEIPPSAEAGQYTISLKNDEVDSYFLRHVNIRSYELPSFRVTAKSVRPYYLEGQKAEVEIHGEYLFGKPVSGGKVRVSEVDDEDHPLAEGPLDSHGLFRATLDPKAELNENQKFEDFHYIAFLTDPSTNRTEQRKFDIRVSRDPIHIYATPRAGNGSGQIYVTTYSPDGAPLRAEVEVVRAESVLWRGRTNRFGLVRIDLPAADESEVREIRAVAADGSRASMKYQYADGRRFGRQPAGIWLDTDRSLYRSGETVKCVIGSVRPDQQVLVIASNEADQVLFTKGLKVGSGPIGFEIPYDKRFGRVLNIGLATAFSDGAGPGRRVYFPGSEDLHLKAAAAQGTYRPGDTATIRLEASAQAALGIAIVDQSVFERAATDGSLGRRRWLDSEDRGETNIGGVTEADLMSLDAAKIDDPDLQLVAEALSATAGSLMSHADNILDNIRTAFEKTAEKALTHIEDAIDRQYLETLEFPRDDESLRLIAGYQLYAASDPWLQPFYTRFSTEGQYNEITFFSPGPDKKAGTADDIEALTVRRKWFGPREALIREALRGSKDYPDSTEAFIRLIESAGLRFAAWRDPWGTELRAEVRHFNRQRIVSIASAGPDRVFGTPDDFAVSEFSGYYFAATEAKIGRILQAAPQFPATPDAFRALLSQSGVDFDSLRDPWGHAYYLAFRDEERFTNDVRIYTYAEYNGSPEERKQLTPIKQTTRIVEIRSTGSDGIKGSYDDFSVADFRRILRTPQPPLAEEKPRQPAMTLAGTGVIEGVVSDPTGAAIPAAEVTLNDVYVTRADAEGKFAFRGLPAGKYRLTCQSMGFQQYWMDAIPVNGDIVSLHITLNVGSTTQTVTVMASAAAVETASASISTVISSGMLAALPLSTPHVRDYFPETLYWEPELVTDSAGHATVRVKLADSVTTWRVAVMGSTLDGRIAETSADIRAFQPFLVDLDVPQKLTVGDEISLPVPVRNYLDRAQKVAITAKLPSELQLMNPVGQPGAVAASSSANAVLAIRASAPAKKAPVRVTAVGGSASDAIEKPAAIHPDGERKSSAVSSVVAAGEAVAVAIPAGAIPGSIEGQVKIYPSTLARILEVVEALLQAPHGCGEQTISSTYPNLLFLKALKDAGLSDDKSNARALKYLRAGYQRLLHYQDSSGGFTYWGHGDTDIALTAYALTFLADAAPFIDIDEDVAAHARRWLAKQNTTEEAVNALRLQALADARSAEMRDLDLRLGDMARKAAEYGDPYALAAYALAAMKAEKPELAGPVIDQLLRAAQDERGAAWWSLRSNTPFHGWGRWGQVETTAMAVSALAQWRKLGHEDAPLSQLIDRGVIFLLRNTDSSGVWATSQSAVRALMALLDAQGGPEAGKPVEIEVRVNGASAGKVTVPGGRYAGAPLTVDVSRLLHAGDNRISFVGFEGHARQVQVAAGWYETWGAKRSDKDLDMQVRYSKLEGAINDAVECNVAISRPAFRGYGMMIANVGLPPGAEVDRGVLEELVDDPKNGVDSYEVAPDHVTFYVWPRAADVKFHFLFRPRYAMKARGAQSELYDYYNPDSRVVLAPETFVVR
jgi:hypothetical protein